MRNLSQDDVRRLLKAESGGLRIPLEELTGDERERTMHLVRRLRLPREAGEAEDLYLKRLGRAEAIERDGIAQSCQEAGQDWGGMRVEATGIWSAVTDADLDRLTLAELEAVTAGFGRRALREPLLALPCSVVELHEFFYRLGEPGIDAESYRVLYELPVLRSWQDLHNCEPQPLAQWMQALAGQVAEHRGIEPWSDAGIAVLDEVGRVIAQGLDTLPMVVPPTWRVAPTPRNVTDRQLSVPHTEAHRWLLEHAPELLVSEKVEVSSCDAAARETEGAEPTTGIEAVTARATLGIARNSTKDRRIDVLDPVIEAAQREAIDAASPAAVYAVMQRYAEMKVAPFLGFSKGVGCKYQAPSGAVDYFTLDALRKRMKRAASRR